MYAAAFLLIMPGAPTDYEVVSVAPPPPADTRYVVVSVTTPKLWSVPAYPEGKTEAELRALYPGIRFPHDPPAAPGVRAGDDPFAACGAGGCPSTPTTPATGAGGTSTSGLVTWGTAGTPTGAPAGTSGITSGCATGNCAAAPAYYRRGLFR